MDDDMMIYFAAHDGKVHNFLSLAAPISFLSLVRYYQLSTLGSILYPQTQNPQPK